MPVDQTRELLDHTFEEIALILGGAFAVHQIPDEAIWQIIKSLDAVHSKAVAQLEGTKEFVEQRKDSFQPHPAVENLLRKLRKGF